MGVLHLNPVDFFFPWKNLLKPVKTRRSPGNTWGSPKNKLRWYPQQPQHFILTNLSKACCEAKLWKHLSWVSVSYIKAANPDLALHQSLPDLLRNLLRNPVEPELPLHQSLPELSPEPCWTWPGRAPKPPRNMLKCMLCRGYQRLP